MKAQYLAHIFGGMAFTFNLSTSFAEIIPDGSMGSSDSISAVNGEYEISAEIGTTAGNNLFHSFDTFNIETGYSADFSGPANISNVVARVTGDSYSSIDGTLGCSITGANLYLINPNGIVFGENATLNVSGSFYASTADYLSFESGQQLHTDINQPVNLAVSDPSSFGFLQPDPAGIIVNGGHLSVGEGQRLGLVGGDITIIGNNIAPAADTGITPADTSIPANLGALSGQIELVSVNSSGEAVMSHDGMDTSSFDAMGTIIMANQAMVTASGNAAGSIVVRGGELVMVQSYIYANAYGAGDGTPSNGIDINLRGDMTMEYLSVIGTDVVGHASDSGGVNIIADNVLINNGSDIESAVWNESSNGSSGNIDITSNSISVSNYGFIQTYTGTNSLGSGGGINLTTGQLNLLDGGQINSLGYSLYGTTGDINITAENILLSGTNIGTTDTSINALSASQITYDVADININTDTLNIDQAFIASKTYSPQGGDITVSATSIEIQGTETINAGIQTNNSYAGRGGSITLNADDQLTVTEHGLIQSNTTYSGSSGDININTGNLEVRNAGKIISSGSEGYGGNSGDINISAEQIALLGYANIDEYGLTDATFIATEGDSNGGISGDINIESLSLEMDNAASISTTSFGQGVTGSIDISAQDITLLGGSQIKSITTGSGDSNDITIHTDSLIVSGAAPGLFADPIHNVETVLVSGIGSQSFGDGDSGNISLYVDDLTVSDGGHITSETFAGGSGGDIIIQGNTVTVTGTAPVSDNPQLTLSSGIFASAASTDIYTVTGDGGDIQIQSNNLSVTDQAIISSDTAGPGNAGNISIDTINFDMQSDATIATLTTHTGNAGSIDIYAINNLTASDALISAQASQSNGGNISFTVGNMLSLQDTEVSSAVLAESGDGGNVTISADLIALNHATIIASAVEGNGGNITITANDLIKSANTIIDASSEQSVSGTIQLSPDSEASSALTNLSEDNDNIASTFAGDCAAQRELPNSLIVDIDRSDYYSELMLRSKPSGLFTVSTPEFNNTPRFVLASINKTDCQP